MTFRQRRAALLVLAGFPAWAASGQAPPERRGPIEARDEWLLSQPRLNLPATSPDLLAPGRDELRLHADWGNDFGWRQDRGGEAPADRRYLVDGEHRSLALEWRRGMRPRLELGLRVPLLWRGPGLLDAVIDWFHGFTRKLGLPDNQRGRFLRDQLRVLGRDVLGRPLAWTGAAGTGVGRLELSARLALSPPASAARRAWTVALVPRLALPGASGPFDGGGLEAGAQLAAARPLGARWDLYLGAGATWSGARRVDGLSAARLRPHVFAALEWRPARRLSLLAQLDGAGRAVEAVAEYPALQSYVRFGAQLDLGRRWRAAGGFSENVVHQQATTDFGVFVDLARRF